MEQRPGRENITIIMLILCTNNGYTAIQTAKRTGGALIYILVIYLKPVVHYFRELTFEL